MSISCRRGWGKLGRIQGFLFTHWGSWLFSDGLCLGQEVAVPSCSLQSFHQPQWEDWLQSQSQRVMLKMDMTPFYFKGLSILPQNLTLQFLLQISCGIWILTFTPWTSVCLAVSYCLAFLPHDSMQGKGVRPWNQDCTEFSSPDLPTFFK